VAVELGDEARTQLASALARLARALPDVRWVDPASVHLTLAFLGELDDERLAAVGTATEEAARSSRSFTLRIVGIGTFGPTSAPRVVWTGVEGDLPRLSRVRAALADALAARGFPRETRPFAPHLTLARPRDPLNAGAVARLRSMVQEYDPRSRGVSADRLDAQLLVDHLSVMKSELRRPAARYTCLRAIPLGARPAAEGDGDGDAAGDGNGASG
jgi:2'-5' RNA ligase